MKTFLSGFHHLQAFFLPWPNFLLLFFSCSICFQFCLSLRGNKNILVSRGRVQDLFLSRRLSFFCPEGEFLSWGPAHFEFFRWTKNEVWVNRKNSKWAGPKDKNSPKGQKSSTWGTKINLVPSRGIPKCFCFLSKTNKIENKLSSWKKGAKNSLAKAKKKPVNDENWRKMFSSGYSCLRPLRLILNCEKLDNRVLF